MNHDKKEEWTFHSRISRSWLKRAKERTNEQIFWNKLGVSIKYSN